MEGRAGLPVSGTPPFPAPVPPPHGTVPAPAVVSSETVLSPVFADLPAGPNSGSNNRTSTGSAPSITSPGHANYQGKLFPSSSVAALGAAGSGFSYLGNYVSPSSSDSFKSSGSIVGQPVNMNQYWLPSSEGYTGFPVGGTHPYPPYFAALNSLPGPGTQGLLAVSSTAKIADGQRIPASLHTRNADLWEGPPAKVAKTSPHGAKEGALSPKTSGHQPGKARHTSGTEDRKASKHDSSRSKAKDRQKDGGVLDEKKEGTASRSSAKTNPKDKGNVSDGALKQEQRPESDPSQDSTGKKPDKSVTTKSRQSDPLTVSVDINPSEPSLSSSAKCNGDSVPSPQKDVSKGNSTSLASSPKSKDSSSDKRKKASKRKDLSVDVNGNAVLPTSISERKPSTVTSESEKASPSVSRSIPDVQTLKEAPCTSMHAPTGVDSLDKIPPHFTDLSAAVSNWTPSSAGVTVAPVVLTPISVPSSGKLSPSSSVSCKATSLASAVTASASLGFSSPGMCSSAATSPSGASTGAVMVQSDSPGVIVSTSTAESSIHGPYSNSTKGVDTTKLNPCVDNPLILNFPGLPPSEQKPSPLEAGVPCSKSSEISPIGSSSGSNNVACYTDPNHKGINHNRALGVHPTGENPKTSSPVAANLTRESPPRTYSLDIRTTEASIAGAFPVSANPVAVDSTAAYLPSANPSVTNPMAAYPTDANLARLSPTDSKAPKAGPSASASMPTSSCSPNTLICGESSQVSPTDKEKVPSPRPQVPSVAFSTCVTSSVSKPISFPAHGSLPSPSSQSQPSYISHLPIYLHGTGHLSLEREVGREMPRDGSKVHATTFVPALGEFIPGPASSATIPVKETKPKTSGGKESSQGQTVSDKEKDKASLKKEATKVATTTSSKDQMLAQTKFEVTSDKAKVGGLHQEGGTKSKEILEVKSTLTRGKGDKIDKHDKPKKSHSSGKSAHESRDHHLSPSDLSGSGKDRGSESTHRTSGDLIHRETCRTSDAAIISTTPSVHSYPHHMTGYSVPLGSMVSSSRDGSKHDTPSSLYSTEEQRRYMEWHMAATKRSYCYDHPGIRAPGQEPLKVDPAMMHRTSHQPSFPSPRADNRPELTPEHCRGRDFPPYTAPQESMLRSVLTAGMVQAHSDVQRTSPGNSTKPAKQPCEPKSENRANKATTSHGGKLASDGLGSQGRSTPGTKGSDGRNPPVGIAVAQKRQDSENVNQGRSSTISTSRNSPHVGSEDSEDRGSRARTLHSVERDAKHRDHSPRSQREAAELLPSTKYHHHRYAGDLGSNLIVTGGTSLGHSPHHYDPADGRMTPSHAATHLAIPPHWLPRAPGQPHAQSLWLGHPFGLTAHAGESTQGHLQIPPAGFQVARDPATGQLVLVPQAPAVHSDAAVPPNLSMWPYLVPPHLQPHSHQLQQLVLNQPSYASPLPHQAPHPLTHRPDQPLPNTDYHFALQQHQEALANWYRQDEQRQREEQRRREQQSRKGSSSSSSDKTPSDKSHKGGSSGDPKGEGQLEKPPVSHDVLNLKIPPHAPYLPGVPLPGQPPVPYVYPPQQVQYLYNHAGVFPAPAVSCSSSPRTESGASTASPKQTTSKSGTSSEGNKTSKVDSNLKTALKSISVQTSPSETPASVDYSDETKPSSLEEKEEKEDTETSIRTEDSEDQELIIVDVVDEDASDDHLLQSEKFTQESMEVPQTNSETEPIVFESKPAEDSRTSLVSSISQPPTDSPGDMNLDPAVTQKSATETILPIAPLNTPPLDTSLPPQDPPVLLEETSKELLISNVLTTTQSFASRMEALDQDQLAAIEGIALLSEVADQKAFTVCSENDKNVVVHSSQTRDDSYLLDNRLQDNGTPLQGNTASAVTSASGGSLQLISQSCPTSPTDFIFKRNSSGDGVDNFATPGDMMNPNEVEMRQRLAELQRKYQEKKRELDKLQRKKDKNPIIKSSTAVLLEAAASLEESSPFLPPKKKKKRDKEEKEKGKAEEKKKSSRKDKETKTSHSETSKSKKRKHKLKEEINESSMSSEDITTSSGSKSKSKSKTKSKASSSLASPAKDTKAKAGAKSRKLSLSDSASSDSLAKSGKTPKSGSTVRSPRSQNSSTEFDTDSGSIIWPSSSPSPSPAKTPSSKSKSKTSKKKTKESKAKDSKKDGGRGQGSNDAAADATMEAIENVIRKSCGSHGNEEKEALRSGALQRALHVYEDDSDSPWETAMIDAKQKRNSMGQVPQKGLALLAGISSEELMKSATTPLRDAKPSEGKTTATADSDSSKKKSGKAKKRSPSPVTPDQETPKKMRKSSPSISKKEKDFEPPSKMPKVSKTVKKKERTPSEPASKATAIKQEKKEVEEKPFFNEEIWTRRRSERIFLSDISPGPSRDASPLAKGHDGSKTPKKASTQPSTRVKAVSEGSGSEQGTNADRTGVANIGSVLDALKTDTLQIRKKLASMSAQEDEKDDAPRKMKKKLSKKRDQGKKSTSRQESTNDRQRRADDILDSSCSEAENLPLSNFLDRQTPPAPRSCIINKEELENGLRVLTPIDGLFYAGYVNAIQPPDVYGVILDGERGNRPHVFSQEQMLQETFIDVKPLSTRYVPEGTRVCAYWSQQFRCLYPGTVVRGTPNPNEDPNFVCVEFDDGDSGRIPVDHIRMLPHDFPIVEFEPIPTELQRKRRRRTSETSSSTNFKQESMDTSEDTNATKAKTNPSKKKPKTADSSSKSAVDHREMDRISESGEDDVFLPHSQKVSSKSKKSKNHDKSKKLSSKADVKSKEKKKKKKRKRDEKRHESADRKRSKRSSSKSPGRSPARSPSRSPGKSKKKKRKEDRKKKSSLKLNSSTGDKSPISKSKSSKKKSSSSSSSKKKAHRDMRQSSFCTVETETVYSTHPITGSQAMAEEESASETPAFDAGKGVWNKHRGTRDHSMDDWSSTDSSKDSSSDSDETSSDSLSSKGVHSSTTEDANLQKRANEAQQPSISSQDNTPLTSSHKSRSSCLPSTSKMTAFLPARQLWNWFGKATQRRGAKGKARKVFYRAIMRENEIIRQGDAAVFLSTGRPQLPYIGRIESMWESWGGNMVVRVKWFYHPEETKGGRKSHDGKMALYQSLHVDENDVQTISHKCEVLSVEEYKRFTSGKKHKHNKDSEDVYYLAGTYDPTSGHITSVT